MAKMILKKAFGRLLPIIVTITLVGLLWSCNLERRNEKECEYNTRLTYIYNRENTSSENLLPLYVTSIIEYFFNEQGVLVSVGSVPGNSCYGKFVSELNLDPGRYTVMAFGNVDTYSSLNDVTIGVTRKEEMIIKLNNPHILGGGFQSMSERLFYGYRTFSVADYGVSRVNVDVVHSHAVLGITVRWKKDTPENTGDFYMLMKGISSNYDGVPEFVHRNRVPQIYNPENDQFPNISVEVLHYIPTVKGHSDLYNHRAESRMNGYKELRTEFVTYRYRNTTHQLLSIYSGGGEGKEPKQVMREIDLHRFFQEMEIDLDTELRQEYEIIIEIDGDRINVMFAEINDWIEGGEI